MTTTEVGVEHVPVISTYHIIYSITSSCADTPPMFGVHADASVVLMTAAIMMVNPPWGPFFFMIFIYLVLTTG